jgi:hypothetical protein
MPGKERHAFLAVPQRPEAERSVLEWDEMSWRCGAGNMIEAILEAYSSVG